jgi:glycerophosphoryl diester phosphodiesterase
MIAAILRDPNARPVIGHRGASGLAPENTLPSFDLAVEQGAEAIEFDVRISADGVAMVHHDPTLDRTCGRPGAIEALTMAQIREADAGATFSPNGVDFPFRSRGIRVPALSEVLDRYPTLAMLIEIKVETATMAVREALARAGAIDRAVVASFRRAALTPLQGTGVHIGAARSDILRLYLAALVGGPWRPPAPVCFAVPYRYKDRIEVPTRRFVAAAHHHHRPVHVWTVNDRTVARRLWDRGVSGIISNFPGEMRRERDGIPPAA